MPTSPLGRRRDGPWEHVGQVFAPGAAGPEDHLTVRAPDGQTAVVRFAVRSFFSSPGRRWWRRGSRFRPRCAPLTSWRRAKAHSIRERCRSIRCHQRRIPARSPCPCRSWPSMPASGALRAATHRGGALAAGGGGRGRRRARFQPGAMAATTPRRLAATRGARLAALPGGNDRALQRDPGPPPRRLVLWRGIPQLDDEKRRGPPARATRPQGMLEFYNEISPRFWAWLTEDHTRSACSPCWSP